MSVSISNGKITDIDYSFDRQADIIIVFYEEKKLTSIKRQTVTGIEPIGGITIPAPLSSANKIKVMIWDSPDAIKPFGPPIEVIKTAGAWPSVTKRAN